MQNYSHLRQKLISHINEVQMQAGGGWYTSYRNIRDPGFWHLSLLVSSQEAFFLDHGLEGLLELQHRNLCLKKREKGERTKGYISWLHQILLGILPRSEVALLLVIHHLNSSHIEIQESLSSVIIQLRTLTFKETKSL